MVRVQDLAEEIPFVLEQAPRLTYVLVVAPRLPCVLVVPPISLAQTPRMKRLPCVLVAITVRLEPWSRVHAGKAIRRNVCAGNNTDRHAWGWWLACRSLTNLDEQMPFVLAQVPWMQRLPYAPVAITETWLVSLNRSF